MIQVRNPTSLLVASFLLALAAGAPAASAGALYSCSVPRALLCEGCASQVTITLLPGGSCRVSFTPSAAPPAASPAGASAFTFEVQPPVATTNVYRRRVVAYAHPYPAAVGGGALSRCFVFNGNRYCE